MDRFLILGIFLAIVVAAEAEKCYDCISQEGEKDGETLRGASTNKFKKLGKSDVALKVDVEMEMTLYRMQGIDVDKKLENACADPFSSKDSKIKVCEKAGKCAKFTGEDSLTKKAIVSRTCTATCQDASASKLRPFDVTCCTGPKCNSAFTITSNLVVLSGAILAAVCKVL